MTKLQYLFIITFALSIWVIGCMNATFNGKTKWDKGIGMVWGALAFTLIIVNLAVYIAGYK